MIQIGAVYVAGAFVSIMSPMESTFLTVWQVSIVPLARMIIALDGLGERAQLIWAQVSAVLAILIENC
jgi:hypothetical protein